MRWHWWWHPEQWLWPVLLQAPPPRVMLTQRLFLPLLLLKQLPLLQHAELPRLLPKERLCLLLVQRMGNGLIVRHVWLGGGVGASG